MIKIIESEDSIEVQSQMPTGLRVVFLGLALIPLIAPYELILKPDWQSYWNIFFFFMLTISAGAMTVSAFLVYAAIAGLSSNLKIDQLHRTITYSTGAPVVPWRTEEYPLDALQELKNEKTEWSEGSPSYTLVALMADGKALKSSSSWQKEEIEEIKRRVTVLIGKKVNGSTG
jgi:hypothetical protein